MRGSEGTVSLSFQLPRKRLQVTYENRHEPPSRGTGALTETAGNTTVCIFVLCRYSVSLSLINTCSLVRIWKSKNICGGEDRANSDFFQQFSKGRHAASISTKLALGMCSLEAAYAISSIAVVGNTDNVLLPVSFSLVRCPSNARNPVEQGHTYVRRMRLGDILWRILMENPVSGTNRST